MIGEGFLLKCIDDPRLEKLLVISRNPMEINLPKGKEILHKDFSDF
jgi:hypothetical protein